MDHHVILRPYQHAVAYSPSLTWIKKTMLYSPYSEGFTQAHTFLIPYQRRIVLHKNGAGLFERINGVGRETQAAHEAVDKNAKERFFRQSYDDNLPSSGVGDIG